MPGSELAAFRMAWKLRGLAPAGAKEKVQKACAMYQDCRELFWTEWRILEREYRQRLVPANKEEEPEVEKIPEWM